MRVGILTDTYDIEKEKVGVSQYIKRLINSMKKLRKFENFELYLIHYQKNNDKLYEDIDGEIICPLYPFIPRKPLTILLKLDKIIKKYRLDVVHLPAPSPFENTIFFVKSIDNLKKIITIHDLYLFFPKLKLKNPFKDPLKFLHDQMWKPSLLLVKDKIDLIISVSYNTKKDIEKFMKIPSKKIKVIYEAPDPIFKKDDGLIEDNYVTIYKNKPIVIQKPFILTNTIHREILETFHSLKKKYNIPHKLVYFGKYTLAHRTIENFVNKLNLQNEVIILGYISEKDLVKLYNNADIFIRPSWYEGFGLPVLEAMACGCPVIASKVGSLPEIVGKCGILVSPHDKEEWCKKILEVISDTKLRKKLSRLGIKRAKMFSWEKTARETIKAYKDALLI